MRFWGTKADWADTGRYYRRAILDIVIYAVLAWTEFSMLPREMPGFVIWTIALVDIPLAIYVIRPRVQRWLGWLP